MVGRADTAIVQVRAAELCGIDRRDLARAAGLQGRRASWLWTAPEELQRSYVLVSDWQHLADAYERLAEDADTLSDCVVTMPGLDGLGDLGSLLCSSDSVHAALRGFVQGVPILTNHGRWSLRREGPSVVLAWRRPASSAGMSRANDAVVAHLAAVVLQQVAGERVPVEKVTLQALRPKREPRVFECLGTSVQYGAPEDSVVLSREVGAILPKHRNPRVRAAAWAALARAASELPPTTTAWVERLLAEHGLRASEGLVCEKLRVPRRELQRRLEHEGTDFTSLRARARVIAARRLLVGSVDSVGQVALEVGFDHAANLTRAYRRYWNESPSQTRARGKR